MDIRPARPATHRRSPISTTITSRHSHATFEIEPIDGAEMLRRIEDGMAGGYPFLVCDDDDEIVGYAYGRQL